MAAILVVGLNPAWQRILLFENLKIGAANRSHAAQELASGKGINVAKALVRLGHAVWLLQILAGETGRLCLAGCEDWGIRSLHAWCAGETRRCTTLLTPDGGATELIEPFHISEPGIKDRLESVLSSAPVFDAMTVCGTIPDGLDASVYADLIARQKSPRVIWDSVVGLRPESLPRIAWIKVNSEEHSQLQPILDASDSVPRPARLITAGAGIPRVAFAGTADGYYRMPAPSALRNYIGAGDTVTAGLTDAWVSGMDPEAVVRHALALGAASCETIQPADWDAARVPAIEAEIRREAA